MNGKSKFVWLKLTEINEHPEVKNVRKSVTKEDVKDLISSIKQSGVENPLKLFEYEGKYYLVSGWRRKKAVECILEENPEHELSNGVPCIIGDYDPKEVFRQALYDNLIENIQREDVNPLDLAERVKNLLDSGIGKKELCEKLGKSITWLNDTLRILEAEDKVKEKVRDGSITISDAKNIAKLPKEKQEKIVEGLAAAKEIQDKKSTKEIKKAVKEAIRERSHEMPTKKEIKYYRNVSMTVLQAMAKAGHKETTKYQVIMAFTWRFSGY